MDPEGLEPSCRLPAADFKSAASANSATGPLEALDVFTNAKLSRCRAL